MRAYDFVLVSEMLSAILNIRSIRHYRTPRMTGHKGIAIPNKFEPSPLGKRIIKPHWWYVLIEESELHSRIKEIADKRAKELACFGGK